MFSRKVLRFQQSFKYVFRQFEILCGQEDVKYIDPCDKLQEFMTIPLFRQNEKIFHPSVAEMKDACKLFVPGKHHEIKFLKPILKIEDAPKHQLPEVGIYIDFSFMNMLYSFLKESRNNWNYVLTQQGLERF